MDEGETDMSESTDNFLGRLDPESSMYDAVIAGSAVAQRSIRDRGAQVEGMRIEVSAAQAMDIRRDALRELATAQEMLRGPVERLVDEAMTGKTETHGALRTALHRTTQHVVAGMCAPGGMWDATVSEIDKIAMHVLGDRPLTDTLAEASSREPGVADATSRARKVAYEADLAALDSSDSEEHGQDDLADLDYVNTPYLQGVWISTTATVGTQLELGATGAVRDFLGELDADLQAWVDGEIPPSSEEHFGIYATAVARAAIPYGTPPIALDAIAEELRGTGLPVPDFDPAEVARTSGVKALSRERITERLEREQTKGAQPTEEQRRKAAWSYAQYAAEHLSEEGVEVSDDVIKGWAEGFYQESSSAAEVTIYSTPNCAGCFATKRALDKAGIAYEDVDLSERPDLVETFKQQGLMQAPIVETNDGDRWAGHRPDKLQEHGLDYRTRQQRTSGTSRDTDLGR